MLIRHHIVKLLLLCSLLAAKLQAQPPAATLTVAFLGNNLVLPFPLSLDIAFSGPLTVQNLEAFNQEAEGSGYQALVAELRHIRETEKLNDWLFYQLIRRTAQAISPKAENYYRYTLYKWFLLTRSGYDASLKISGDKLLFYVHSEDNIYNIPFYTRNGKTYTCLNYHDYGSHIDFDSSPFREALVAEQPGSAPFSYAITRLPEIPSAVYQEKELQFRYNDNEYHFTIRLNPEIKAIFNNYPVVDYAAYFNIPMSRETHVSLIPMLKKNLTGLSVKNGVDYLMHFTRYAFPFKPDQENFGGEKRLTPEQTLLYPESDCEDRAALFFYLVKEIYNLPMIVLSYPKHVTVAVRFDKPMGKSVIYNGIPYTICEPTPQRRDLPIGKLLPELSRQSYDVVYAYQPAGR